MEVLQKSETRAAHKSEKKILIDTKFNQTSLHYRRI